MRETQGEMEAPLATLKEARSPSAFPLQPVLQHEGLVYRGLLGELDGSERIRTIPTRSSSAHFLSLSDIHLFSKYLSQGLTSGPSDNKYRHELLLEDGD